MTAKPFAISVLFATLAIAAEPAAKPWLSSPRRTYTAPELKDAPDEWIQRSFDWADDMLLTFKPGIPEHPARRAALIRLDDILHIESAPRKPIVQQYFLQRMEKVIGEIESTKVTEGFRVWKLYNHGFLVRTPTVSFTFDFVPGPPRNDQFRMTPAMLERLVAQSDATFISHLHLDHASEEVARLFVMKGKPVVVPEGLWKEKDFASKLSYPERTTKVEHTIAIQGGRRSLRVVAFPGHQGAVIPNNVHLVRSPEDFTVMQTGDQSDGRSESPDFEWIPNVGHERRVDVLLPNCWTSQIQRMLRGVNPGLVITGHENEMAHTVDHREDYTQTYHHLYGSPYPFVLMTWGESYHVRPKR